MAEIITQKEKKRRFWTIIICAILDVFAIGFGAYGMVKADELEKNEQKEDPETKQPIVTIATLTEDCFPILERIEAIKENKRNFSDPWGWVNYSTDTQNRFVNSLVMNDAIKDYLDLWVPELPKIFLSKAAYSPYFEYKKEKVKIRLDDGSEYEDEVEKRVNAQGGGTQPVIKAIIDEAIKERDVIIKDRERLDREINQSRQQEITDMGAIRKDFKDQMAALPGPIEQFRKMMEEYSAKERSHFEELHALEQQVAEKRRERDELLVKLDLERKAREAEVDKLKTRVRNMKLIIDDAEAKADPDARIIAVDLSDGLVRTTLTRDSRVFNFMRFKVFSIEKGLQRVTKGEIEIIELHDSYSVGRIERTIDEKNPFKPGDFIWSARYDPKLPNYFIVAGRLTRYSRSEVMHKLQDLGDVYQDKLDDRSQYCIVGDGYENDPVYKEAYDRGMRIYAERHLYQYLGFPH